MASIVLTGLSANDPTPGNYMQVNFAQGPASGSGSARTALLIGNFTAAGTATAGVVYGPDTGVACQTESDVITLAGTGSELHRMWLKFTKVNQATSLYLIGVTQSVGANATLNTTLLTVPTASGTWSIYVEDELAQASFATGDTLASITATMVTAINGNSRWAVTAAQATVSTTSDSVAITAKQKGPRGNFIANQASITGAAITTTNTARAFLAGGTTADSNASALAAVLAQKFDYICSSAEDAAQFGAVVTQVNSQALPLTGIRQRCYAGAVDATIANVNTIAISQNSAPSELIWQKSSDWTPAEIAAHAMGAYALLENSGTKPRLNFSLFPVSQDNPAVWQLPAPRSGTQPSAAEVRSALANGVTPLGNRPGGKSFIWKRITTRSTNGAVNDYRTRDAHKVCVPYFFADDLQAKYSLQFGGKDLTDDPKLGGPPNDGQTVSASNIKSATQTLITEYGNRNLFRAPDVMNANLIVQRETSPTTRVSVRVPTSPVDILDQICTAVDQVS